MVFGATEVKADHGLRDGKIVPIDEAEEEEADPDAIDAALVAAGQQALPLEP